MSTLLSRSESDIAIARLLLSPEGNPTNDEMITYQAAYHTQQAIEKALKYKTEMMGIEYRKIHNLVGLISDLENHGFITDDQLKEKPLKYQVGKHLADTMMILQPLKQISKKR